MTEWTYCAPETRNSRFGWSHWIFATIALCIRLCSVVTGVSRRNPLKADGKGASWHHWGWYTDWYQTHKRNTLNITIEPDWLVVPRVYRPALPRPDRCGRESPLHSEALPSRRLLDRQDPFLAIWPPTWVPVRCRIVLPRWQSPPRDDPALSRNRARRFAI